MHKLCLAADSMGYKELAGDLYAPNKCLLISPGLCRSMVKFLRDQAGGVFPMVGGRMR